MRLALCLLTLLVSAAPALAAPAALPNLGVAVDLPESWMPRAGAAPGLEVLDGPGLMVIAGVEPGLRCGDDWSGLTGNLVHTDERWFPESWHRVTLSFAETRDGQTLSQRIGCFQLDGGRLMALVTQAKSDQEHLDAINAFLPVVLDRVAGALSRRAEAPRALDVPGVGKVDGLPGDWTVTDAGALRYRDRFGAVDVRTERVETCDAWAQSLAELMFVTGAWSPEKGGSAVPSAFGPALDLGRAAAGCAPAREKALVVRVSPVDDGRPHPATFAAVATGIEALGRAAGVAVPTTPHVAPLPAAAPLPALPAAAPLTLPKLGVTVQRDGRWRVLPYTYSAGATKYDMEVLTYRSPDVAFEISLSSPYGGCEEMRKRPDGKEDPNGPLPASFGPVHRRAKYPDTWQGCAGSGATSLSASITLLYGRVDAATRREVDATIDAFRAAWVASGGKR